MSNSREAWPPGQVPPQFRGQPRQAHPGMDGVRTKHTILIIYYNHFINSTINIDFLDLD